MDETRIRVNEKKGTRGECDRSVTIGKSIFCFSFFPFFIDIGFIYSVVHRIRIVLYERTNKDGKRCFVLYDNGGSRID